MESFTHADVDSSGHNLLQDLEDEDQVIARGKALVEEGKASYWPLTAEAEATAAALPSAKRNKEKDWDGSATRGENVIELSSLYRCQFCQFGYPQASFLANVNEEMAFVSCADPFLEKTTRKIGFTDFQNLYQNPLDACARCC